MHSYDAMFHLAHQHRAELIAEAEQRRIGRRARVRRARPSAAVTHGRRAPRDGLLPAGI